VTLEGHQGVIFNIEYCRARNYLFTTSDDRSINVWSLQTDEFHSIKSGSLYTRFYGHDARVWKCVTFSDSNDVEYVFSVGEDLNCCLWNVMEKSLVHRFNAMRKGTVT
jgi:WD40 repeat protein